MTIRGSCDCGKVCWSFAGVPEAATACSCGICRRYGVLWAYDFEAERIAVDGPTRTYLRGDKEIAFHFCPDCGCVAYWRAREARPDGRRRIAVNLRLADEPEAVAAIPIKHLDGRHDFKTLPPDGKRVGDLWF